MTTVVNTETQIQRGPACFHLLLNARMNSGDGKLMSFDFGFC